MFSRVLSTIMFVAALGAPISRAEAHPKLVSATPAVNSNVATAPTTLSLKFNESITAALSSVTLLDAAQHAVTLAAVRNADKDATTLVAKVTGNVSPGRYTVKWQAAGKDGHPVKGEFTFVVDVPK